MGRPDGNGYININIREVCDDNQKHSYAKLKFPYSRFDLSRFRMYSSLIE